MPIEISWSEIDAYRQCPMKHHLSYRERWTTEKLSTPLRRGNLFHEVMEQHYRALQGAAVRNAAAIRAADDIIQGLLQTRSTEQTDDEALIQWMYEGYKAHYGFDPEWEIVEVEWQTKFPLNDRFTLKIRADLIVRFRGRLWLVDHKTGGDLPNDKELDLDDQFGLYTWAMRQIEHPIMGALYNAARTKKLKRSMNMNERFRRVLTIRTDHELDMIAKEAIATAERMWPQDEPESRPEGWAGLPEPERNPDPDRCSWRCSFLEPCLASRKGINRRQMMVAQGYVQDFTRH